MATLKNTTITGTGYLTLPAAITTSRPVVYTSIVRWTNTGSQAFSVLAGPSPTVSNTSWTCPVGVTSIEVLVVAGGGSGGNCQDNSGANGGGGGAGGLIYSSNFTVTPGTSYTVTVGAGGASQTTAGVWGNNGSNSVFGSLTAIGGGGGGADYTSSPYGNGDPDRRRARDGGSGGGGGTNAAVPALGVYGQGNNGGYGQQSSASGQLFASGGGGAGTPGFNGTYVSHGRGGDGLYFTISGTGTWYAGGGGAGGNTTFTTAAPGGLGGGGAGAPRIGPGVASPATAGTASTGGGGGGGCCNQASAASASGAGGSGVVIIRYSVDSDNTVAVGTTRYNSDAKVLESFEGPVRGWISHDPQRNYAGHNLYVTSSMAAFSTGQQLDINASSVRDPFGGLNAYYLQANTASNTGHSVYLQRTSNAGIPMTFSVFAKTDASNKNVGLYVDGITNGIGYVSFNLTTGATTVITSSSGLTSYGSQNYGNGWWRCWVTGTTSGAGTYYFHIDTNSGTSGTFADTIGNGIYAFGPQMEEANSPSPYTITSNAAIPAPLIISGYKIHAYTNTGTSSFTPAVSGVVEVLVVAGGGGGGSSGGGGGGGVVYNSSYPVIANQSYTVTVGAGGAGAPTSTTNTRGSNGSNSQFGSIVAVGGGGGGTYSTGAVGHGNSGGSGGGGGTPISSAVNQGFGTIGQGYPGGAGYVGTNPWAAGGGGGAGGAGTTAIVSQAGAGGNGVVNSILGSPYYWGGGGGGGAQGNNSSYTGTRAGDGGLGGGGGGGISYITTANSFGTGGLGGLTVGGTGAQSSSSAGNGASGGANTGGGGGGQGISVGISGTGGSGIVIVRYRYD